MSFAFNDATEQHCRIIETRAGLANLIVKTVKSGSSACIRSRLLNYRGNELLRASNSTTTVSRILCRPVNNRPLTSHCHQHNFAAATEASWRSNAGHKECRAQGNGVMMRRHRNTGQNPSGTAPFISHTGHQSCRTTLVGGTLPMLQKAGESHRSARFGFGWKQRLRCNDKRNRYTGLRPSVSKCPYQLMANLRMF